MPTPEPWVAHFRRGQEQWAQFDFRGSAESYLAAYLTAVGRLAELEAENAKLNAGLNPTEQGPLTDDATTK